MDLPEKFNEKGLLPAGDYILTIDELLGSMLVNGPNPTPINWDAGWRRRLVVNLAILANQLWGVGIKNIFIDGSFVEEKDHPNDIDGYFECDRNKFFNLLPILNGIDPHKCWDWSTPGKPKMWQKYQIELYPHYGQPCGIDSVTGHELQFPAAFRQSREFEPKGIVKLIQTRGKL
jgi:hypothetical protein